MSGTSLDGIDVVLVSIDDKTIELNASYTHNIPQKLRQQVLAICTGQNTTLPELGAIDHQLGKLYAAAANKLLSIHGIPPEQIRAIGNHGQTVFHQPDGNSPFTMQIGDANLIAALTGIDTVSDFRRMDMALGGQGAPLTPAFHRFVFANEFNTSTSRADSTTIVLNIGGIANVTLLPANTEASGFDTGPGNILMDAWCDKHTGNPFDKNAEWAIQGQTHKALLNQLLSDPFITKHPPKSTGREHYNLDWLQLQINAVSSDAQRNTDATHTSEISAVDVQRTLCEFTARSIVHHVEPINNISNSTPELLICGGGVNNPLLIERLQKLLPLCTVQSTTERGIPAQWVEAMAFAWLARQRVHNLPGNLPSVTGSTRQATLGVLISA